MIEKTKAQIKELEEEIRRKRLWIKEMEKPQYCQHCGKQIDKDYLPSYSCEKCVEEFVTKLPKHCVFGK